MVTNESRAAAKAYHQGWAHGDGADDMRGVMAEDFSFTMGDMVVAGREAFLAGGGWPEGANVTMLAEAYDGEHGFQLYDCVAGEHSVRMCEHRHVRDGVIASVELIVDHAALGAFLGSGVHDQ